MTTYSELAQILATQADQIRQLPIVTGFDGFVDEMISVVDQRQTLDDYKRIETIARFGEKISAAAGHSSLREIVINEVDLGQILNLAMQARLMLACASSGFFVRHARSPSLEELVEFMETLTVAE